MPAASFDLASFNFQVPNCASVLAKHTAAAANRNAIVIAHVFVFILPPMRTNCLADLPPRILVRWGGLCNYNAAKGGLPQDAQSRKLVTQLSGWTTSRIDAHPVGLSL